MKTKSFTLIELLVVIVIIGILAGVIIVSTSSSINKANFAKAQAFSNTVQQELLLNLVSEWTFDEGGAEDTWGNNDGTLGNGVTSTTYPTLKTRVDCISGDCMGFDGGDHISISDRSEFNFGSEMSAFIWIKGGNTASYQGVLSQWDDGINQKSWLIYHASNNPGKLRILLTNNGLSYIKNYETMATVLDNAWHLVGFSFKSGVLKVYLDGRETEVNKIDDSATSTLFNSSSNLCIGCWFTTSNVSARFHGLIDDVRIYNAALSSSQIKQNYIAGLNSLFASNNISKEEYDQRLNNLAQK